MSTGSCGLGGLERALGFRAPMGQSIFRSFINGLLPHSLFAAKSEIDYLAHAVTRR
jgi:hypothetical protein